MVYANQQAYYDAITASTNAGQSGPFIDFMLNEIYIDEFGIKFSDNEKQVLLLLCADPSLSASEIADRIGISKRGVEKQLKKFKDAGILTRKGNNRTGSWIINKRN